MHAQQLDLQAVAKADERFWAKHPELHKRVLTSDSSDARYRSEWLNLYEQAERESVIPAPSVLPKPVPTPPPVNGTSPVQPCPGVASMTHEEKMEAAIHSANLGEEVLRELGDIKTLVTTMVIAGGGLAVAGVAAAATGVGLLIEGVAAVGAGLLVLGAAMSGWQIGQGLNSLYDFFQETRCDTATTPQQLYQAGKKFGEGVAKVGIGTVNLLLSILGGRGKDWRGQKIGPQTPKPPQEPLKPPAKRHYVNRIKQSSVAKSKNSVVEPWVDMKTDVAQINSGQAVKVGDKFIVNGRTYGQHDGTLYPISGPGVHPLDRGAFKALGVYNEFGDTPRAEGILNNMKIEVGQKSVALAAWKSGKGAR